MTSHSDKHVVRIIGHAPDEPVLGWSQHWRDFPVGTKFYTSPPKREPLEGVVDVRPIGHHSLQLIFRSQADIAKFKAAHGIGEKK